MNYERSQLFIRNVIFEDWNKVCKIQNIQIQICSKRVKNNNMRIGQLMLSSPVHLQYNRLQYILFQQHFRIYASKHSLS